MESPTTYDQIIQGSSLEERKVAALEEQAAQQRRIADALEVLAASEQLDRVGHRVAILAKQQEDYRRPERQQALDEHLQVRDALSLQLTGLASPWR